MVCETPETAVPATIDPKLAVLQVIDDISAVPLEDGLSGAGFTIIVIV
jgi:hypothetical protein